MPDDVDEAAPRRSPAWVRFVPGVAGALLVAGGLAWIWPPLGLVALGAAFLVLDWRVS